MSHSVTIVGSPDWQANSYSFSGSHDPYCLKFQPCEQSTCRQPSRHYEPGDQLRIHGARHEYQYGGWLVESDQCALDYAPDSVLDGVAPGNYPIIAGWDDGEPWFEIQDGPYPWEIVEP